MRMTTSAEDTGGTLFQALFESAPYPQLILAGGQVCYANEAAVALIGRTAVGEALSIDHLCGLAAAADAQRIKTFLTTGSDGTVEFTSLTRDGDQRHLYVSLRNVEWAESKAQEIRIEDRTDSEQELQAIYSMAPIGIAITDASFRFVRTNKAYQDILGRSEAELRSMTFLDVTHPDDLDIDTIKNKKILSGQLDRTRVVKRYLAKDGATIWVNVNSSPLYDSRGIIVGSVATVEDITVQRSAEHALIRSEAELAEAQRIAHIGSWTWSFADNIQLRSAEFCRIYGVRSSGHYSTVDKFLAPVHPDDRKGLLDKITCAIQHGTGYELTHRILRPNGEVRVIHTQTIVEFDEAGRPALIRGADQDVTDRRVADDELRRQSALLASAERIAHMGSWESLPSIGISWWSDEVYEILGISRDEGPGSIISHAHHDDRSIGLGLRNALRSGKSCIEEFRIIRGDGEVRTVRVGGETDLESQTIDRRILGFIQDVTETRQAEGALRESELRFRTIFEEAAIGITMAGTDGCLIRCNPAYSAMLGYELDEMIGRHWKEFTHPDDVEQDAALTERLLRGELTSFQMEKRYIHKSGEAVWARVTVSIVRDDAAQAPFYVAMSENITAHKQAEEALRDSEKRYRQVFSLSPDPLIVQADDKILMANNAAAQASGYQSPDDMIGASFIAFVHPDDRELVERHVRGAVEETGDPATAEVRWRQRTGQIRILEIYSVPFRYMGRSSVLVAARDNTQRRTAQREADKARADLTDAIEHMDDGFALFDAEGRLEYANARYKNLVPWNQDLIVPGRSVREIVTLGRTASYPSLEGAELQRRIDDRVKEFEAGGAFIDQFEDGRWMLNQDLKTKNGRTVCYRTDITLRKEADATARDLEKKLQNFTRISTMGELASSLAHELNQPLTAVINFIEASRYRLESDDATAPQSAAELLEKAMIQASRAGDIIQGVRRFIQERDSERKWEDINDVIGEIWDLATVGSAGLGLEIRFEGGKALPPAYIDRTQIQQVVINLMRNGIEAMEGVDKRLLVVKTGLDTAGSVSVSVNDTGSGLADKARENLFQPFNTQKPDGMGFGLSICHSIIESHGGIIWAESEPGEGTMFCFSLPLNDDGLSVASEG